MSRWGAPCPEIRNLKYHGLRIPCLGLVGRPLGAHAMSCDNLARVRPQTGSQRIYGHVLKALLVPSLSHSLLRSLALVSTRATPTGSPTR